MLTTCPGGSLESGAPVAVLAEMPETTVDGGGSSLAGSVRKGGGDNRVDDLRRRPAWRVAWALA